MKISKISTKKLNFDSYYVHFKVKFICMWSNELSLQGYGFSPVWVLRCDFKLLSTKKDLGHWLQGKGFLPSLQEKALRH